MALAREPSRAPGWAFLCPSASVRFFLVPPSAISDGASDLSRKKACHPRLLLLHCAVLPLTRVLFRCRALAGSPGPTQRHHSPTAPSSWLGSYVKHPVGHRISRANDCRRTKGWCSAIARSGPRLAVTFLADWSRSEDCQLTFPPLVRHVSHSENSEPPRSTHPVIPSSIPSFCLQGFYLHEKAPHAGSFLTNTKLSVPRRTLTAH